MKKYALVVFIALQGIIVFGQLPNTEVWLMEYSFNKTTPMFFAAQNVSNNPGYDNQPAFSENGSYLLWTSSRDSGQTDLYRYEIGIRNVVRTTNTAVSEYSPQFMPGNKFISAVVVEKDSTQRLWKYNRYNGSSKLLIPKLYAVGYYCWYDANTLFAFQLSSPTLLVAVNVNNGMKRNVATNVGRCLQIYRSAKKKVLLYTEKNDKVWTIKAIDKNGNKDASWKNIDLPEGVEDFAIDKRGNMYCAKTSVLYYRNIENGAEWTSVQDLAGFGFKNITRLAFSPDGKTLALVTE